MSQNSGEIIARLPQPPVGVQGRYQIVPSIGTEIVPWTFSMLDTRTCGFMA